jgi:hypothetical protein
VHLFFVSFRNGLQPLVNRDIRRSSPFVV